jgi:dihydroxyacid dehydratase/phosphogluconate dehydratase
LAIARAPRRWATIRSDYAGKPVIAIINIWSDINPCHTHFKQHVEEVKRGVWEAGGFPVRAGWRRDRVGEGQGRWHQGDLKFQNKNWVVTLSDLLPNSPMADAWEIPHQLLTWQTHYGECPVTSTSQWPKRFEISSPRSRHTG